MHRSSYCLIAFLLTASCLWSQVPEIQWQVSLGGSLFDQAIDIQQTSDLGYIVAGESNSIDDDVSGNHGGTDFWIVKLSSEGSIVWQRSLGGSDDEHCWALVQTNDLGYLVSGRTASDDFDVSGNHGGFDIWIIKLNSFGDLIWQRTLGGSESESTGTILALEDGNIIVAGSTASDDGDVSENYGGSDFWLVKLDADGYLIWENTYGGSGDDVCRDVQIANDGTLLLTGKSDSDDGDVTDNNGFNDYWIIKVDEEGNLLWQQNLGGSLPDEAISINVKLNTRYFIAGYTQSDDMDVIGYHGGDFDSWVVKLDSSGLIEWKKCYGGTGSDLSYSITKTFDNNIISAGYTGSTDGDIIDNHGLYDYFLIKIDTLSFVLWEQSLGGSNIDICWKVVQTTDQGYILCGGSKSTDGDVTGNHGDYDYWIVKLEPDCEKQIFYSDADGDGYGDLSVDSLACEMPVGYVSDSTDCDDTNAFIHPLLTDACNGFDDDCDTEVDEDAVFTLFYLDFDNDNYGTAESDSLWCDEIPGYVIDSGDCDDSNPDIYPGAPEVLNGLDDDCDGLTDEDISIIEPGPFDFTIYPNPTAGVLNIECHNGAFLNLQLFDITGQFVQSYHITALKTVLDLSFLVPGVYVLQFRSAVNNSQIVLIRQ